MPQPRWRAGNSSLTTTNDVIAAETMNVRVAICAITNWSGDCASAVANEPTLMPAIESSRIRRRPIRSANGSSRNAGSAPSRVAAVNSPCSALSSPNVAAICGSALPSMPRS